MTHQRRLAVATLTAAVAIAAACSKPAPPPPPAPAPAPAGPNQDSIRLAREAQLRSDSITRAENMRRKAHDDSVAAAAAAAKAAADAAARDAEAMRATIAAPIHYDFDKSALRDDAKALLDAKLPILTANSGATIRIAGHTDERGSGEYNLQLGQRRAAAARDYLTARGVNTARIELVSYGEERPLCQEKVESCWMQNRRAEFEITAGGNMLKKP